jgi:polyisoprenoid-binding protein YceI
MRSFIIIFRAILTAIYFLPLEIYDWFKNTVLAGKSTAKIIIVIIKTAAIAGFISIGSWNADAAKAGIRFDIGGPFGTVQGSSSGLSTTIVVDENDLGSSSILGSIQRGTMSTGISMRNKDLREKQEWLDTKKYPMISFHSMKIVKTSSGYKAISILTMKSIAKPDEIPFIFIARGNEGFFKGKFDIRRRDFNAGKEGGSVPGILTIMLEVPVKK